MLLFLLGRKKKGGEKERKESQQQHKLPSKKARCSWQEAASTLSVSCLVPSPRPGAMGGGRVGGAATKKGSGNLQGSVRSHLSPAQAAVSAKNSRKWWHREDRSWRGPASAQGAERPWAERLVSRTLCPWIPVTHCSRSAGCLASTQAS